MLPQHNRIMKLTDKIFKDFYKSHRKVIGLVTIAVLSSKKSTIAELGRALPVEIAPKHNIKRVDRFLGNEKIYALDAAKQWIPWLIGPRKQIIVNCDWTRLHEWPVLYASLAYQGRSIPLFWAVMDHTWLNKSYNTFENTFFGLLLSCVPKGVDVIFVLDRGFKRASLLRFFQDRGAHYVIRSSSHTYVDHPKYQGLTGKMVEKKGTMRDLKNALLSRETPTHTRIVTCWDTDQKEPWILLTNLDLPKRRIVKIYGNRFQIEETFRDHKSHRYGMALRHIQISKPDRLERLLLITAIAHTLATLIAHVARQLGLDHLYSSSSKGNKVGMHSDFSLGVYYYTRLRWTLQQLNITLKRELHVAPP